MTDMTDNMSLSDRMKRYEQATALLLPPRCPWIIRVDGRAFHSFLRNADKPYDQAVVSSMNGVAVALCQQIAGAVFAYVQSDEVSVLVQDYRDIRTQPFFGGNAAKVISISASIATNAFNRMWSLDHEGPLAQFDSRVFPIADTVEVANYFVSRQHDAVRNSIMMAARAKFSHGEVEGKNGAELQEMLWEVHGINWSKYADGVKRGRVATRSPSTPQGEGWWYSTPAPEFRAVPGNWLATVIPNLPTLQENTEVEGVSSTCPAENPSIVL
jgi:tRNA(His) guanylyltransferase